VSLPPFRVLTVCIGNICRSPLAERLLRLRLADELAAGTVTVESAGVGAVVGHGVEDRALVELERLGGSGGGFTARQVTPILLTEVDLVLTATVDIRTRSLREAPRALKRTFTLGEFAAILAVADADVTAPEDLVAYAAGHRALAQGDLDVADPIGLGEAKHRAVADQIDGYVSTIVSRLGPLLAGRA
jgi:protein-tyrosine phosphatase